MDIYDLGKYQAKKSNFFFLNPKKSVASAGVNSSTPLVTTVE